MSRSTPTQRSLALLRREGYRVAIVERWNAYAKLRQDLFGFADLLAVHPEQGTLLVQCTTVDNQAARLTKILALAAVRDCLAAGLRVEVWGWAKRGARGQAKLWDVTRRPVALEEFPPC